LCRGLRKSAETSLGAADTSVRATVLALAILAAAHGQEIRNPLAGDAHAVEQGQHQFRLFCGRCHGIDARGGDRGPDLTSGRWTHGGSDAAVFRTIANGVAGTEMPGFNFTGEEVWGVIAFLRSLGAGSGGPLGGDREKGAALFRQMCAGCHMVNGRGGRLGPDLSRIGASRSHRALTESLRHPDKEIADGYETAIAVTNDGQRIAGIRKNEDAFSLQLMDQQERLHLFVKKDLKEVIHERKSLMPAYGEASLHRAQLEDLLAYLDSLRGVAGPQTDRPHNPAAASVGVTYAGIVAAAQEPQNWITYSGNYAGQRHSTLRQIDTENVLKLAPAWVFQHGAMGKAFEATPLVSDGVLYGVAPGNSVFALDARTGRRIWAYQRRLPEKPRLCCGQVNRGVAALGDKIFVATVDAHVLALDAKTGSVVWDVEAQDYRKGYSFTLAPLVVKDKVIVGVAGGEFGIRGFIDAYEAETGKRAWRFYTVPGPGEPGHDTWPGDTWKTGAAPAWVTGAYDPALNLLYWPTGNPGPDLEGEERAGSNLYSNCIVALDPDNGELKWHFQFTPHDVHDWDATETPVLLDLEWEGRPRKLLAQANRNGFFYLLDRVTGQFLLGKPFVRVTWAREIGRDGRPVLVPGSDPTPEGNYACPGLPGGVNWNPSAYSPDTGLFYVPAREQCDLFFSSVSIPATFREGLEFFGSSHQAVRAEKDWGALRAIDPSTGAIRWEHKFYSAPWSGVLSTAGGLVFTGDEEGYVMALDARTGRELWHFQTGAAIQAPPITFALGGKQYVAVGAGANLFAFALPEALP
jgi:alcohol dehydrogenase (cytochrome c)